MDLMSVNRETYDLLNFMGDIGGLDSILALIGFIIMQNYSKFNFYSYLISLLFV